MFGVFINRHVVELIGAVGVADVVHEGDGLSFFAFGLFAGDLLRHTGEVWGRDGRSNQGERIVGGLLARLMVATRREKTRFAVGPFRMSVWAATQILARSVPGMSSGAFGTNFAKTPRQTEVSRGYSSDQKRRLRVAGKSLDMLIEDYWQSLIGYFVVERYDKKKKAKQSSSLGTVFFVSEGNVGYAVTCRHVVEGARQGKAYIQVNARDPRVSDYYPCKYQDWIFSETADLAVHRFDLGRAMETWLYPMTHSWAGPVRAGQDVFIVGLFTPLANLDAVEPIIRFGRISHPRIDLPLIVNLNTDDRIETRDCCLVDSLTWSGQSGSPVLVYEEFHSVIQGFGDPQPQVTTTTHSYASLIGVMHGHFPLRGEIEGDDVNSGIAAVIPVRELRDLLNVPILCEDRNRQIELSKQPERPEPPRPDLRRDRKKNNGGPA